MKMQASPSQCLVCLASERPRNIPRLNSQASGGRIVAYVAVVLFLLQAAPSAPLTCLEVLYFISSKNRVKNITYGSPGARL